MKIPYPMVAATPIPRREAHMTLALQTGLPRIQRVPIDDRKSISIACYGPSLEQTYQQLTRPILSMSGATRWLADRGIIADYHIEMDPRPFKPGLINPPIPGVHYLMATICHPSTWEILKGEKVTLWHAWSAQQTYDWVNEMDKGAEVIHGGSTIGLTALTLCGFLGFRHFEIHGMDGSFTEGRAARHAGPHPGTKQQDGYTWTVGGKKYETSRIMANAVAETMNQMQNFPFFCVFHGEGLTQALIREHQFQTACCADETERADKIRHMTANILGPTINPPGDLMPAAYWDLLIGDPALPLFDQMAALRDQNEPRRARAKYNTGSVTLHQMVQLRMLCQRQKPKTIIEVGTFIGNSAMAMQADKIYTCDRDNDCLPSTSVIRTFPYTKSTDMFVRLLAEGVVADMFFLDGRLDARCDLELVKRLSHPRTIYVVDDYAMNQKGIVNMALLVQMLDKGAPYSLIECDHRVPQSTLAVLAPRDIFDQLVAA